MDHETTIQDIKDLLGKVRKDRNWEKFHTPKELAVALTIETGEILELFRWMTTEQVEEFLKEPKNKDALAEEIADVVIFTTHLADVSGVDIASAVRKKIAVVDKRYPADIMKKFSEEGTSPKMKKLTS